MFVFGPHNYAEDSEEETETDFEDDPEALLQRRREECERKARRGEMDPRLEYTFQLLIDATGLTRHEVMDYVFEADMLDEINQLFLPNMRTKLMWFYQDVEDTDHQVVAEPKAGTSRQLQGASIRSQTTSVPVMKKKLFLTDGWDVPLTGMCIYIFRTNTVKQLPEEGFQKVGSKYWCYITIVPVPLQDLYCGIIDAQRIGLVTTIERIIEHVFMEALAHPSPDAEDDAVNCPMVKNQLLPGLRSFCSTLRVCEDVCDQINLFNDGKYLVCSVTLDELKEMVKKQEFVAELEERVKIWIKKLSEILKESDQIRKESDSSGPQDELEYWKKRGAQFSQIVTQVQATEVQRTVMCLQFARSKMFKEWKETDYKITYCYNEAKDNAKFIQTLEKNCHSLYLDDPVKMQDSLLGLLQTVRLIHTVSQFYNTSERTSSLMVKITNQMIETCKEYINCRGNETIWTQDRQDIKQKLTNCIMLNKAYQKTYATVKNQQMLEGDNNFNFSENYIFGKFNAFCGRLGKIIAMFDLVEDYSFLFQRRMEGLLMGEEYTYVGYFTENIVMITLEEAMQKFEEIKGTVMNKKYNYLDHRNSEYDADFETFMWKIDDLKINIADTIEENFESVWETPQGITFLTRFEMVFV
ncbi:male fertility factor kl5 [Holotrichia oblita]|uniref:Male fertility factor kl5 n=1 Tax=Holotrichia oblita TaxID=644536 RepID=A0ACB9TUV6_HOLOL|nr:male fertility factor kl5 [Holotrichia oblita]